jgi:hypothetical protein
MQTNSFDQEEDLEFQKFRYVYCHPVCFSIERAGICAEATYAHQVPIS